MNNKLAREGNADEQQNILAGQVNLFLFDLKNESIEHGFRAGESWHLELATDAEIRLMRKQQHPVVSIKLQPSALLKAYQLVKSKLQQPLNEADAQLTAEELTNNEKGHLAAYPIRISRR